MLINTVLYCTVTPKKTFLKNLYCSDSKIYTHEEAMNGTSSKG